MGDDQYPEHYHEVAKTHIGKQVETKKKFAVGFRWREEEPEAGEVEITGILQELDDNPRFYKIVGPGNNPLLFFPAGFPRYKLVVDEDPAPGSQASDPGGVMGGRRRRTRRRRRRSTSARTSKRLRRKTARASANSRARSARTL